MCIKGNAVFFISLVQAAKYRLQKSMFWSTDCPIWSELILNFNPLVRAGSSQGSHTSKYFGSIDSSENDHSRKQPAGGSSSTGAGGGEEQFIKCVLQDPIWLLMANTDDKVMMTYQLPVR